MSPINRYKKLKLASAVSLACAVPTMASAAVLEEIFVTAQKQEQRIMEIPISVSAVTGEKITEAGINNLADMSAYVPGLHIGKGPINTTINIRGIGSGIDRGFEQSVGMYIDGIYMGRARQFRSPFLDPQRVEVLRGPQGILFGKNTIAGAINIISADPVVDGDTEGNIQVKVEEHGTYETTGVFSTSLTDTVAARLAVKYRESDGEVNNVTLGTDEPEQEETSARLTVVWEPNDQLSVNAKLSYSDFSTEGNNAVPTTYELLPQAGLGGLIAATAFSLTNIIQPDLNTNNSHDTFRDDSNWSDVNGALAWGAGPEGTDTQATSAGVTVVYEFESGWTIHSVTGYSEYDTDDRLDADFMPIRFLQTTDVHEFDQLSQEFRISYLEGGPFEFVGGLYVEQQNLNIDNGTVFDGTFDGQYLLNDAGAPFGQAGSTSLFQTLAAFTALAPVAALTPDQLARSVIYDQESETLAAFGELTWYIRDDMRVTVGGRYSKEGKDVEHDVTISHSSSPGGINDVSVISSATDFVNIINYALMDALFATVPHTIENKGGDEEYFDPSVKLQWDIDYDNMVYASYSYGHKSGGFNSSANVAVVSPTQAAPGWDYDAEEAKSFEIGYKGMVADSAIQLGISAFMTDYDDLQVAIFEGTAFTVGNAASADLYGIEIEVRYAMLDNLEVGGSFAYLDFEFSEYDKAGCTIEQSIAAGPGCGQDLSGERNAFAPEYSGNLFSDYSQDVFNGLELKATVDVNFKSEMFLDYDLDERTKQAGYGKVNMRVALVGDDWEAAVFGRNLGDKQTHSFAVDTPLLGGSTTGWVDEGKTFGAEAKYMF